MIFAAYRCIFNCNDALEAELHALMQCMAHAAQYASLPVIIQSDSSEALLSLTGDKLSRSIYGHLIAEIKHLMVEREFFPLEIKGEQKRIANWLAWYSRTENTIVVWLGRGRTIAS